MYRYVLRNHFTNTTHKSIKTFKGVGEAQIEGLKKKLDVRQPLLDVHVVKC